MISKDQFKAQVSRIAALFMRDPTKEWKREVYEIFKEKDFNPFEAGISDIIKSEDRWPTPHTILTYYDANAPRQETLDLEAPTRKDLEKAAKTSKHKHYLKLIFGLMDEEITIDHPEVQKCLDEQGPIRVFSHYDKDKRCFVKPWRETHPKEQWDSLKERLNKRMGISGEYVDRRKNYFAKLRKELRINEQRISITNRNREAATQIPERDKRFNKKH